MAGILAHKAAAIADGPRLPRLAAMSFTAFVSWPSAPLTDSLVRRSLSRLNPQPRIVAVLPDVLEGPLVQFAEYDVMDHELTRAQPERVTQSAYTIRKALIRKHFLHRCIRAYVTKHPKSLLQHCVPRTWDIEISFADELEDMWADELWDLAAQFNEEKWYILKPGMADRGMGIRLFNSREALQDIFDSFETESDDELVSEDKEDDTGVITSQLRHFVIQVSSPFLQRNDRLMIV